MKKALLLGFVLLLGIVLRTGGPALAIEIDFHTTYGASVAPEYYEGFVQWDDGIFSPDAPGALDWANAGTTLSWLITWDTVGSNTYYTYSYTWATDVKALSHIIIELTDGMTLTDLEGLSGTPNAGFVEPTTYSPGEYGNSDPELPGEIYGIKCDDIEFPFDEKDEISSLPFEFWFTTEHEPVWGNFYAKSGVSNESTDGDKIPIYAYNTGFEDSEAGVFIARPNGISVPEPSTMLLLGVGLIGLAGIGRKKFVKKQ